MIAYLRKRCVDAVVKQWSQDKLRFMQGKLRLMQDKLRLMQDHLRLMQDNLRLMQEKLRLIHGAMIHGARHGAMTNGVHGVHGALTDGEVMQQALVRGALIQTDGALMHQALMGGALAGEALIRKAVMADGALMHQALMGGALIVIGGSSKEWSS